MHELIEECNDFLKDCGFPYAFCGGYALELFLNRTLRTHSDVDISIFEEDKAKIIEFMLSRGWNVYEHKADWIDNKKANAYLRAILSADDSKIPGLFSVWAVKPACSCFKIEPRLEVENTYNYEILNGVQLKFDFLEIIFNKQKGGMFVFDSFTSQGKNITRALDKAVLRTGGGIPYLAPEVKLFIISNPVYLMSDYHKVKNRIDFDSTAPSLPEESREWLINALETAYPGGLERIERLKDISAE